MPSPPEIHPLETVTLTIQEALTGRTGKPATVAGVLRMPSKATARVPAVVLLHGGNGLDIAEEQWQQRLNDLGIATFLLDSFAGRAIHPSADDREELATLTMLVDSYRALAMLAKDPRIDPGRIAVMGFSMGGAAALYASNQRFHNMYAAPGTEFAAHIGLYAPCYWRFHEDDRPTSKPIRLFQGGADDWSPIGPCRSYVQRLKANGADIVLKEYPNASHAFDNAELPELKSFPKAVSLRECELVEGKDGVLLEGNTGKPFDVRNAACIRRGAHVGYNRTAAIETVSAVEEFLSNAFGLGPYT
jgi:dienelactone hydrolase